jgi:hypothetical protein
MSLGCGGGSVLTGDCKKTPEPQANYGKALNDGLPVGLFCSVPQGLNALP